MAKRTRAAEGDFDEAEPSQAEDEITNKREITGQIIRMVFARELRQQSIRREHFSQASAGTRRVSYDQAFATVQGEMEHVYGLKLVEASGIPGRLAASNLGGDSTPTGAASQGSKSKTKQPMVVTSTLKPETREVLSRLWTKRRTPPSETEHLAFIPKRSRGIAPLLHQDLLKTGMATFVLVLLIVGNNHLTERDLWRELSKMGLPDSLNIKNSNTGMSKAEFIGDLVKREYIQKSAYNTGKKTASAGASAELLLAFTLGRRALSEFTPESAYALVKAVYGDGFDASIQEQCAATIEAAFQVKFTPQVKTAESSENGQQQPVHVKGEQDEGLV